MISQDGNGVVAQEGGNLSVNDGSSVVAQGGSNYVQAGGNVVAQDGGHVVAQGGGNFAAQGKDAESSTTGGGFPTISAVDLQTSKGWFAVRSSGNSDPTYTSAKDSLDGTNSGKLNVKFDDTSNPKISNLQGVAFAVALDPPILQLANTSVNVNKNVNKDAGFATVTVNRTGPNNAYAYIDANQ